MAFREVTMEEVKEVLRRWAAGEPKKRIARQLGIGIKTVRSYVTTAEAAGLTVGASLGDEAFAKVLASLPPLGGRPRGEAWSICEAHRSEIKELIDRRVKLTKVRRLLSRKGIVIPYAALRRFAIAELGFANSGATIPVSDCAPGAEVQLDTGWVLVLEPDIFKKRRRVRAWIFTAVLSRHRFVYPCFDETTKTAIEACEAAWEHFGGVFRAVIVDNTKAIVVDADPLGARITPAFLEYSQVRGFVVDTTRVRSPKDKARVERSVQTVRDDCYGGERISELDGAHERARIWTLQEYGMRAHSTTKRRPLEQFLSEEQPALLPAPTAPYDVPLWCEPKVARDQHAQVAKALYSLPTRFVGKKLRARADRTTVRFYDGSTLVKTHPRQLPGRRSMDPNDFPAEKTVYATRDIAFLERAAAAHGESVGRFAKAILAGDLPWTRMRQAYALLSLVKKYGATRVNDTCGLALAADMHDVRRLARMLERAVSAPPAAPPSNVIPLARYLRPASQYALPLASGARRDPGDER